MTRIFLQYIIPLVLPTAIYFMWRWGRIKRAQALGISIDEEDARTPPWFWLAVCGFILMAGVLGTFAFVQGSDPKSTYQPPRIENGQVVPGQFK